MNQKTLSKELLIGLGLGLLTNLIWAIIAEQLNPYVIGPIFVVVIILYFLIWRFVLKPFNLVKKDRFHSVHKTEWLDHAE